jgi:hypothetical protein
MKKLAMITASALMVVAFAACGSSEKTISGDVNNASSGVQAVEEAADSSAAETSASASGYVFEANGVTIKTEEEAAGIIDALGTPSSYFEATSCAFGDLDKTYTYAGFELDTYSMEGVDYVSSVIILDDSVATPEGLTIGDDAAKVTGLYGEATSVDGDMLVYKADGTKLCVQVIGDKVTSIQYLNTVLDED